jgi:hypothetical protein
MDLAGYRVQCLPSSKLRFVAEGNLGLCTALHSYILHEKRMITQTSEAEIGVQREGSDSTEGNDTAAFLRSSKKNGKEIEENARHTTDKN